MNEFFWFERTNDGIISLGKRDPQRSSVVLDLRNDGDNFSAYSLPIWHTRAEYEKLVIQKKVRERNGTLHSSYGGGRRQTA